jgi:hypothetical protein
MGGLSYDNDRLQLIYMCVFMNYPRDYHTHLHHAAPRAVKVMAAVPRAPALTLSLTPRGLDEARPG